MAFNPDNNTAAPARNDNFEKAVGFVNLYLPGADGSRKKIGSIPLRASKAFEKSVFDRLVADPEGLKAFMNALQADFQPAENPNAGVLGW